MTPGTLGYGPYKPSFDSWNTCCTTLVVKSPRPRALAIRLFQSSNKCSYQPRPNAHEVVEGVCLLPFVAIGWVMIRITCVCDSSQVSGMNRAHRVRLVEFSGMNRVNHVLIPRFFRRIKRLRASDKPMPFQCVQQLIDQKVVASSSTITRNLFHVWIYVSRSVCQDLNTCFNCFMCD